MEDIENNGYDEIKESDNNETCTICLEELNDIIKLNDCSHSFCKSCIYDWFNNGKNICPLCRTNINTYNYNDKNYQLVIINNEQTNEETNEENINLTIPNYELIVRKLTLSIYHYRTFIILYMFYNLYCDYVDYKEKLELTNNYKLCLANNTNLQNEIDIYENNSKDSVYISIMFDGIINQCKIPLYFIKKCMNHNI